MGACVYVCHPVCIVLARSGSNEASSRGPPCATKGMFHRNICLPKTDDRLQLWMDHESESKNRLCCISLKSTLITNAESNVMMLTPQLTKTIEEHAILVRSLLATSFVLRSHEIQTSLQTRTGNIEIDDDDDDGCDGCDGDDGEGPCLCSCTLHRAPHQRVAILALHICNAINIDVGWDKRCCKAQASFRGWYR